MLIILMKNNIKNEITKSLIKSGYILADSIKSLNLYFIVNKKIYLLFQNDEDFDEIGFINT